MEMRLQGRTSIGLLRRLKHFPALIYGQGLQGPCIYETSMYRICPNVFVFFFGTVKRTKDFHLVFVKRQIGLRSTDIITFGKI